MSLQKKCLSGVTHQKYRLNVISKLMKEVSLSNLTLKKVTEYFEHYRYGILYGSHTYSIGPQIVAPHS